MIKRTQLLCKRHDLRPVVRKNTHLQSEVLYLCDVNPEEQHGEVPGEQQECSTDPQLVEQRHITQSSKRVQRAHRTETGQRRQKQLNNRGFILSHHLIPSRQEVAETAGGSGKCT